MAMELVDGIDLHRVLRERGALPPREAFDILIQVTKGLAAIHGAGVIHRDLKTPNIMLDSRGDVRLLDFGIAKLRNPTDTSAITSVQKVVGTPEYMSPEQIRGDDLDERSDIYGLGIVIYELFTGTVPFRGKSPLDTLVKQMNTPPPLYGEAVRHLPPSLVPLLRRCLAKSVEERYSSARELLEALRVARNSEFPDSAVTLDGMSALDPETAPPPPPPPPLPRAAERPHTPPTGPPRNPIAGPPPLPPTPPVRPLAAEASPPSAPPGQGRNLAHLGTGLAFLGLLVTAGAWLWQRPRSEALPPPDPGHDTSSGARADGLEGPHPAGRRPFRCGPPRNGIARRAPYPQPRHPRGACRGGRPPLADDGRRTRGDGESRTGSTPTAILSHAHPLPGPHPGGHHGRPRPRRAAARLRRDRRRSSRCSRPCGASSWPPAPTS